MEASSRILPGGLIPTHFAEVKVRKETMLDKTAKVVKARMAGGIYSDYR
ncbi:MAG: hypothetical protein K1W26_18675 [Acetatifactor sp.]